MQHGCLHAQRQRSRRRRRRRSIGHACISLDDRARWTNTPSQRAMDELSGSSRHVTRPADRSRPYTSRTLERSLPVATGRQTSRTGLMYGRPSHAHMHMLCGCVVLAQAPNRHVRSSHALRAPKVSSPVLALESIEDPRAHTARPLAGPLERDVAQLRAHEVEGHHVDRLGEDVRDHHLGADEAHGDRQPLDRVLDEDRRQLEVAGLARRAPPCWPPSVPRIASVGARRSPDRTSGRQFGGTRRACRR